MLERTLIVMLSAVEARQCGEEGLDMLLALAMCAVTVFPRYGTYVPAPHLHGPGLLLDGAGASSSPDNTLTWLHARLLGDTARRGGNVVILRASYANIDDRHFYDAGKFASVQTVLIPPCAATAEVNKVATIVNGADAVYFAGGDQANYVRWKGTELIAAVKRVYARGGVVGGGSAGLAIQGAVVYDSVAADAMNLETTTADAATDPLEPRISFTTGLFTWPALQDTITDTHLVARDRLGRTIAFLARIFHDRLLPNAEQIYALGIDEASAVVVDPDGTATLLNGKDGRGAYLVRTDTRPRLVPGQPLHYTVEIAHIARNGERFDLLDKASPEPWYTVTVDGSRHPVYNQNPYDP
jgi:cyanophycinase-like exopeptidase